MKVVLITNIPTPYRFPVYDRVSKANNFEFEVIYCSEIEFDRKWKLNKQSFNHNFEFLSSSNGKYHTNFNLFNKLNQKNPDVVITCGFNLTMLFAFLWALLNKKKHIPFTDGTIDSEKKLTLLHVALRKIVYRFSDTFIGASKKSIELYKSYGIDNKFIFKSVLSVDNDLFKKSNTTKKYDLMFSGQLINRKNPLFFLEIFKKAKQRNLKLSGLIIGDGKLKNKILSDIKENNLQIEYCGFIQQRFLPKYFNQSKVFIFPTLEDPWGLVANEALASKVPVIASSNAGCANEIVIDNNTGFVIDNFDLDNWLSKIEKILKSVKLYNTMSNNCLKTIKEYNFDNASKGIIDAINASTKKNY